ncbi:MAG: hypothetical protein N2322_03575 [Terrimicrobiaceae bacterium]|nr:hypothetical protein [Terrimicrobiaceae bacterium]
MNRLKPAAFLAALLWAGIANPAAAQEASPAPAPQRSWFWRAKLPGGEYIVRLDAIRSLSMHEYLVEGVARVTEVNIAADASALARFYFLEPAVPQAPGGVGQSAINFLDEKAREAVTRAGAGDALSRVIKSYPAATHAHTIEYRLGTREQLEKLYRDIERAWTTGRGGAFEL